MKFNSQSKKTRVIIYDDVYDVKKDFTVRQEFINYIGNKIPIYLVCCLLLLMCALLIGNKDNIIEDNIALTASNKKKKKENKSLSAENERLTIEEEKEHVQMLIGKYTLYKKTNLKQEPIQKDSLYNLLVECHMWYPDIVYAQIIKESSIGQNVLETHANNITGMKYPGRRKTTAYGKAPDGYAQYANWQLCVIDKMLWDYDVFKYKKPTREQYLSALNDIYNPGHDDYRNSIESIIKKHFKE